MKTYSRQFIYNMCEKIGIARQMVDGLIRQTEDEMSRILPEDFDFSLLKRITCNEFLIYEDEFDSSFKYGTLPKARQCLCYAMYYLGARNKQIMEVTGFSKGRISNSVTKISKNEPMKLRVERIIKNYHANKKTQEETTGQ